MVSHTTTGEWQSFELRMRRRRAERLALRAQAAVDAGCFDDARACLEEARSLAPNFPRLAEIERQIAVPPPVTEDLLRETETPVSHGRRNAGIAAVLAVAAVGTLYAAWAATQPKGAPDLTASAGSTVLAAPQTAQIKPEPLPAPSAVFAAETAAAPAAADPVTPDAVRASPQPEPAGSRSGPPQQELPSQVEVTADVPLPIQPVDPPPQGPPDLPVGTGVTPALIAAPPVATAPVSAPEAVAVPDPPAPAAAEPRPAEPSQEPAVRSVLNRYASAYSALDADAAQQVWPGVNRAALARAFDSLASQRISLGDCRIGVAGTTATATCAGTATWAPKIGGGGSQSEARSWSFELARAAGGWQIVSARVQNK